MSYVLKFKRLKDTVHPNLKFHPFTTHPLLTCVPGARKLTCNTLESHKHTAAGKQDAVDILAENVVLTLLF